MTFTPEEQTRVENFILFLIQKKQQISGEHNGFSITDISKLLVKMEQEGKIKERPNPTKTMYYLNK